MDLDTAMEGYPVTMKEATRELEAHGMDYKIDGDSLMVPDFNGGWDNLPLRSNEVLEWLGY